MWKFLNTAVGSWLKVIGSAILGHILIELETNNKTIVDIFTKQSLIAYGTIVLTSTIPILLNWFNPNDTRYGDKGKPRNFKPENNEIKD